jgi:general secretion pathway protein G
LKSRGSLSLIALLVVLACREPYDAERDAALKQTLARMRGAIARFHRDEGRYPRSLDELVPRYLPNIPVDPITKTKSWRTTTEESVQPSADFTTAPAEPASSVIVDVHSGAPGADRDGVLYSNY